MDFPPTSKCREHNCRVGYMELRDGTLTMYMPYQFACVAQRIGGTLGATVTNFVERYLLSFLR